MIDGGLMALHVKQDVSAKRCGAERHEMHSHAERGNDHSQGLAHLQAALDVVAGGKDQVRLAQDLFECVSF